MHELESSTVTVASPASVTRARRRHRRSGLALDSVYPSAAIIAGLRKDESRRWLFGVPAIRRFIAGSQSMIDEEDSTVVERWSRRRLSTEMLSFRGVTNER